VRGVLTNPKHTGYQVWNRRASKSGRGRCNAPEQWVWSPEPTHEPLVTREMFIAAQQVAAQRERSRSGAGPNARHPATKRTYSLRSYVLCGACQRRMFGKSRRDTQYYACQPAKGYVPPGHDRSVWVRENHLLDAVLGFFSTRIFHPSRAARLQAALPHAHAEAEQEQAAAIAALQRRIEELETRRTRLLGQLEMLDEPHSEVAGDVRSRVAELYEERRGARERLEQARSSAPEPAAPELLDTLPISRDELGELPETLLRALFEAFRLQVTYDRPAHRLTIRVTLSAETLPELQHAAENVLTPGAPEARTSEGENMHRSEDPFAFPSEERPLEDSNLRTRLRRPVLYPLS
jgi:site-specific DNA recombinase